jgi:hypothetical protein
VRLPLPALIAAALVAASAAVVFVVPWDHAVYVAVTAPGASTFECVCKHDYRTQHVACTCGPPGGPGVVRCDDYHDVWECRARCLGWYCRGDVQLLSRCNISGWWSGWLCTAGNATVRCQCGNMFYEHNGTWYYRGTFTCRCAVEVGGKPALACFAFGCPLCRFEAYAPCERGPLQLGEREWCPVANATGVAIPVEPGWIVRVECLR